MALTELIKAGIKQEIAEDLSYRYYKNELTHKDIEYLKENFDIKFEKVEASLNNKIETVRNELKADIRDLDIKIDNVENNLNNKIDNIINKLKSDIASVNN